MEAELEHPHDLRREVPDRLPAAVLRELSQIDDARALRAVAGEWAGIGAAMLLAWLFPVWWAFPLYVVWIGARQHALAVILHDAVHYRLLSDRRLNDIVGNVLCGWPVFISVEGFRLFHSDHHRFTNAEGDGNRRLWGTHGPDGTFRPEWRYPTSPARLALRLLWRGAGPTGLWWMVRGVLGTFRVPSSNANRFAKLGTYAVAAALLGALDGWTLFFWAWVFPFCTWHVISQYVRLICEHSALPTRPGEYAVTRTTLPRWWELLLVIPRHIGYHLEHHWYPSVPFYRLPELHAALLQQPGFRAHAVIRNSVTASVAEVLGRSPTSEATPAP